MLERGRKRDNGGMLIERTNNVCFSATPDMYFGYSKGNIMNRGGYYRDGDKCYEKPDKFLQNSMALSGDFHATSKFIQTQQEGSAIFLKFIATEINLVLSQFGKEAIAEVMLDGKVLPLDARGSDLNDSDELHIKEQRAYSLLKANYPVEGILSIRSKKGIFRAYSAKFLGCVNSCL